MAARFYNRDINLKDVSHIKQVGLGSTPLPLATVSELVTEIPIATNGMQAISIEQANAIATFNSSTNDWELLDEGQVKLNGSNGVKPRITGYSNNVPQAFVWDGANLDLSASPTTQFPVSANYPIYSTGLNTFLEDPIPGVITQWRVNFHWGLKANSNNTGLTIGLVNVNNPTSSFMTAVTSTLPSSEGSSSNLNFTPIGAIANQTRRLETSVLLTTVADNLSIGTGYKLFSSITINDADFFVEIDSIIKQTFIKRVR